MFRRSDVGEYPREAALFTYKRRGSAIGKANALNADTIDTDATYVYKEIVAEPTDNTATIGKVVSLFDALK